MTTLRITKEEVIAWATHVALYDAEGRGLIVHEVVEYLEQSIEKFTIALLDGKIVRKDDDGTFSIADPDEDSLTVGDDIG